MQPLPREVGVSLAAAVGEALSGAGRAVVVSGEAGAGKTTLVRTLATTYAETARVLWGACEPLAASRPLEPLHDLARSAGGELAAVLASDLPRQSRFAALVELLEDGPAVVVVEDLHWADEATLDLVVYLGRRLPRATALVVTCREEGDAPTRVLQVLGHLAELPGSCRLHVGPLSQDEVRRLAHDTHLDPERVHRLAAGNAFFVTELLAADGGVPGSVRAAVLGRTARLSESARALLDLAAVVPDRVEVDLLYDVGGSPDDLDACERTGLLESNGRTAAFRHELAREAVAGAIAGSRRRELHRAVLDHLLARVRHQDARICYHADLAGDDVVTVDHGVLAAAQAARLGSAHEARVHLGRARDHLDGVPATRAAEVLGLHAEACHRLGWTEEALSSSEESLRLWREVDDTESEAAQLSRHSAYLWHLGHAVDARVAAQQAVAAARDHPGSGGLVAALASSARLHMLAREIPQALEQGRLAVELARARGDTLALAGALGTVGTSCWFVDPDSAEPTLTEAAELARRAGDDLLVATHLVNLGSGAGEVRRYAVARRALAACQDWCAERDLDRLTHYATAWLARVHLEVGDWPAAAGAAAQVPPDADLISRITAATVLGRVAARRGDRDAQARTTAAWELAVPTGDLQRLWPAAAGRAEAARDPAEVPALVADTFATAVALGHPWAVGELGWWLVRSGTLAPDDARLDGAAAPYGAMVRGRWADAADLWDGLGCSYDAALARSECATVEQLAEAVSELHRIGATADADRVAARLRELDPGAVPRRPRRATAGNPGGLTDRELDVLDLLTAGLSNVEIGDRLFISPRTTAHHVSAILAKLGVESRRDAARVATSWAPSGRQDGQR
ncbi:ATP-binding protein [Nocardioides sp. URHA0020]|uniref:ATP-binding protein n=1 Tax=Nocardioides sp. URHA0020 TaxID=1380392 RepID=UPI00049138E2|nr:AAA family ATPase [Nocardioides sp. URHA0020]